MSCKGFSGNASLKGHHLHIVCPGLFFPGIEQAREVDLDLAVPALERLLTRAKRSGDAISFHEEALCRLFGLPAHSLPVAALTYQHDFSRNPTQPVVRVDPVFLVPQGDYLVMEAIPDTSLRQDELQALTATLNATFRDDGFCFEFGPQGRWYMQLPAPLKVSTTPLPKALGVDMFHCMPSGPDAVFWRQWYTELQMILHTHSINQAREERGEWPINGLWMWGEGDYPASIGGGWSQVYADDALAIALARAGGVPVAPVPSALHEISPQSRVLVVMPRLAGNHVSDWRAQLHQLEAAWFAPLLQAIKRPWTTCSIQSDLGVCYEITKKCAWLTWRRRRLQAFA